MSLAEAKSIAFLGDKKTDKVKSYNNKNEVFKTKKLEGENMGRLTEDCIDLLD